MRAFFVHVLGGAGAGVGVATKKKTGRVFYCTAALQYTRTTKGGMSISITDPALRDAVQRYVYPRTTIHSYYTPLFMRATCREWYMHLEIPGVRLDPKQTTKVHIDGTCVHAIRRLLRHARRVTWWDDTHKSEFSFCTQWHGGVPPAVHGTTLMNPDAPMDPRDLVIEGGTSSGRPFLLLMKMLEPVNGGDRMTYLAINGVDRALYQLLWYHGKAKLFADRLKQARGLETLAIGPTACLYISTAKVEDDVVMAALATAPNLKRLLLSIVLLPESYKREPSGLITMYFNLGKWLGKRATGLVEFSFWSAFFEEDFHGIIHIMIGLWENLCPSRAIRVNVGITTMSGSPFSGEAVEGSSDVYKIRGMDGVFLSIQTALERLPNLQLGIFFHSKDIPVRRLAVPLKGEMRRRLRYLEIGYVDLFRQKYTDDVWDKPDV